MVKRRVMMANILDVAYANAESIQTKMFASVLARSMSVFVGVLVIVWYSMAFMTVPVAVNVEILSNDSLTPLIVSRSAIISALPSKVFNLNIVEEGGYRPRALGFLVQYFDVNLFARLKQSIPWWGNRLPFTFLAALCMVAAVSLLVTRVFPNAPLEFAFMIGTFSLFFQMFQIPTYVFLRSAKLLTPSTCLFLVIWFINKREQPAELNAIYKYAVAGIGVFVLATLDEQVLATVVFLAILSAILSVKSKKMSQNVVVFCSAGLVYATYHLWWGKNIFRFYTGGLVPHVHQIGTIFSKYQLLEVARAGLILIGAVTSILGATTLAYAIFYFFSLAKVKDCILRDITLSLVAFSLALATVLLIEHRAIYYLLDVRVGFYILPSALILMTAALYTFGNSTWRWAKVMPLLLFGVLLVSTSWSMTHVVDAAQRQLSPFGGHMQTVALIEENEGRLTTREISTKEFVRVYYPR